MLTVKRSFRRLAIVTTAVIFLASGMALAGDQGQKEAANKQLVRTLIEEGYNERDYDIVSRLQGRGYIAHINGVPDSSGIRGEIEDNLHKVPDFQLAIEDMVAEGDMVVTRVGYTGRHAQFNTDVRIEGVYMHRIQDGKISEAWVIFDLLGTALHCGFKLTPPEAAQGP